MIHYKNITKTLQRHYKDITKTWQRHYKDIAKKLQRQGRHKDRPRHKHSRHKDTPRHKHSRHKDRPNHKHRRHKHSMAPLRRRDFGRSGARLPTDRTDRQMRRTIGGDTYQEDFRRREFGRTNSKHLKQVSTVLLSSQILMFLYFIARVTHICRTCINTYITCGRAHQAPPPSLFFFTKVPFILKCVSY